MCFTDLLCEVKWFKFYKVVIVCTSLLGFSSLLKQGWTIFVPRRNSDHKRNNNMIPAYKQRLCVQQIARYYAGQNRNKSRPALQIINMLYKVLILYGLRLQIHQLYLQSGPCRVTCYRHSLFLMQRLQQEVRWLRISQRQDYSSCLILCAGKLRLFLVSTGLSGFWIHLG